MEELLQLHKSGPQDLSSDSGGNHSHSGLDQPTSNPINP